MVARIPISVAALVRDGRVLLVHRHPSREHYPDCWDLVGGHFEQGEHDDHAVVRADELANLKMVHTGSLASALHALEAAATRCQ